MLGKLNNKKNILLVDDDRSVTQMLSMLLETRGYGVSVVHTGGEAIDSVTQDTDLILLDLVLPDTEGFEVCRRLKEDENTRHIPIIILSAKLLSGDIVEGLYLGADDYLTKPFEYEELVARMEAVIRRASIFRSGKLASQGEEAIIREIRHIIDEELIIPFFQPIFLLESLKIHGFEALCRPQTQSMLASPELLFKAAIQFGFYQELEIVSWKKALEYAFRHITNEKIFLNCNPYLVEGAKFATIRDLFVKTNILPQNVVLEITERSAISDFEIFYKHLHKYREHGFKFAVDDVGGGYASLESIVETKPEVVKIDRHIITNLYKDDFKKSIVKFIVSFCKENNILAVAEGIETKEDLQIVRELGVEGGQGYYLYKPSPHINFDDINETVSNIAV